MLGQSFSHYRVIDKLGEGAMGVVYLAEDTLLGRRVAVKFPNAEPRLHERLLAEARTASSLSHPAIAAVYDCGIHDERPYVVMELVEGENLKDCLKRGPLAPERAIEVAQEAAAALAEAHRHNIVHRDIKPSNIQFTRRGAVKVLDFGVAKDLDAPRTAGGTGAATQTAEQTLAGTPPYMSPEQARAEPVDGRSDLFSLGAVLWECLTGRPAFAGRTPLDIVSNVLQAEPPPPSTVNRAVPPVLDRICSKALAKNPDQRYQSAEAFLRDLAAAQSGALKAAVPSGNLRVKLLYVAVAAALAALLGSAAILWLNRGREPDPQALRWYQEGANAIHDGTYYKAAKALERAVSLDSGFALAHARLAEASDELDDAARAREQMLEAVAPVGFRTRLSSLDETSIEAIRRLLTNDAAGAAAVYRQLLKRVPESERAAAYLDLGRACDKAGQPQQALASYRQAAARSPQYAAAFLHLGVLERRAQRFADAEADFARAESLYQALSNAEGMVAVLYERGVMANTRGDLREAGALFGRAREMARATGSPQQQIETLLEISNLEGQQGDSLAATRHATEATELARRSGLQLLTAGGLIHLGNSHFLRGDLAQAQNCFQQALDYARRFRSARTEARALLSLGSLHIQQEDLSRGIQEVQTALRFYDQGGDAKERSAAILLLGRAHRDHGDYTAAMQAFQEQLELAAKTGDQAHLALAREGIATVLEQQEHYPDALAAYRQTYADSQARGDRIGASYALANSGPVLAWLGRYAEAREALAQAAGSSEDAELARTLDLSAARIALSQLDFVSARRTARKLRTAPVAPGTTDLIEIETLECSAGLHFALGEALSTCATALDLARKSGIPRLASNAQLAWAEAQLQNGNLSAAKEAAVAARAQFARGGQHESEARALLTAARAARALRDIPGARPLASQATESLRALQQSWTSDDRTTYESRPDVRQWRTQLAVILTK